MLHWLFKTDAGLLARMIAGVCIFAAMAAVDLARNGSAARKWREYGFLGIAVFAALLYGVVNDQITSRISWEYFFYGKELFHTLGDSTPPDMGRLHWESAKVGAKATWSVGLLFGVALLLANNPRKNLPQLRNRRLAKILLIIPLCAACLAIVCGLFGYFGFLNGFSTDFQEMAKSNIFRPPRFMATWGIHLGGYLGGAVGTILAVWRVIRLRKSLR